MVDNIGSEDFVVTYESYNPKYMMYGYVSDYPLNALWGFRYAGTWKNNAEIERNKTTKGYVSAGNNFYSPGAPRYLDINHDGILNKQDLVYLVHHRGLFQLLDRRQDLQYFGAVDG